jgi:hypothetical protein
MLKMLAVGESGGEKVGPGSGAMTPGVRNSKTSLLLGSL